MFGSDVGLLKRWHEKADGEAFAELVARHASMVFGTCLRVLRNPVEAEDVTLECFVKLGQVRRVVGDSLGGLLHTMATHQSLDRLKAESRRREREIRYATARADSVEIEWDDLQPHVDEAIAALPQKFRCAVVAHFLEGETKEAVARSLGLSESAVRYRISKGIDQVRAFLRSRDIAVGASAFTVLLQRNFAEGAPLPASLAASLGKLAVSGASGSTGVVVITSAALLSAELKVAGALVAVALLVVGGLYGLNNLPNAEEEPRTDLVGAARPPMAVPLAPQEKVDLASNPDVPASAVEESPVDEMEEAELPAPPTRVLREVTGVVMDAQHNPIAHAEVHSLTMGWGVSHPSSGKDMFTYIFAGFEHHFRTRTDGEGRFRLMAHAYIMSRPPTRKEEPTGNDPAAVSVMPSEPETEDGEWFGCELSAFAEGYANQEVRLKIGPGTKPVIFLKPGLTLRGRVRTAGGEPVTDAIIRQVQAGCLPWGQRTALESSFSPSVYSQADGSFVLGCLDCSHLTFHVASGEHGTKAV